MQSASPDRVVSGKDADLTFLAADVGGTHARIALVHAVAGALPLQLLRYSQYTCGDWPSLAAILGDFLHREAEVAVSRCALAIAGYPIDGDIINDNLAWPVSMRMLRQELELDDVALVNDFAALAHAVEGLDDDVGLALTAAVNSNPSGPRLVVGPGTGFGASLLIPHVPKSVVLATEAGQLALAPRTALERDVLAILARGDRHVSTETALSGPGILNLYRAICTLHGQQPVHVTPSAVVEGASGNDEPARQALSVFCGLLGSFVGDLTMVYGASGGVYLAGGVMSHLREILLHSDFVERFVDKGGMRAFLERVPVRLLEHGQLGVLGAADWYLRSAEMSMSSIPDQSRRGQGTMPPTSHKSVPVAGDGSFLPTAASANHSKKPEGRTS